MRPPALPLLAKTTCPHCWANFDPADVLWISVHQDLREDPHLGPEEQLRFLPSLFSADGEAIDLRGMVCRELACPSCHLPIPRAVLELEPHFVSVMGTPSCGKSYYLAALSWQLRQLMPSYFALTFADADPTVNITLTLHEQQLFLNPNAGHPKPLADLIQKTATTGDPYHTVFEGDHTTQYLKPFLFTLRPKDSHPSAARAAELARLLVLYDNSGEHFRPGAANVQVSHHLPRSQFLLYLFDPTQDPRFRKHYQKNRPVAAVMGQDTERQDVVLREAATRIRRLTGRTTSTKHDKPLIIVVTKCDLWGELLNDDVTQEPWLIKDGFAGLDRERVLRRSQSLRTLLEMTCPEFVSAAEEFAENVTYMPASALGHAPVVMKTEKGVSVPAIRPMDIAPVGVLAPMLYGLNLALPGLIMSVKRPARRTAEDSDNGRPVALGSAAKQEGQSAPAKKGRG